MDTVQYIEMDLGTLEIHIDLPASRDPVEWLYGDDADLGPQHRLDQIIEDRVIDAVGEALREYGVTKDFTIRVKQPPPPPRRPLVRQVTTIPF